MRSETVRHPPRVYRSRFRRGWTEREAQVLALDGDRVVGEERMLWGRTRFRQVLPGPDGMLYILTDEDRGRVLRLEPAP